MMPGPYKTFVVALSLYAVGMAIGRVAAETSSPEPGPIQRIEETLKRAGKSMEDTMKNTGRKVEEEKIPEKVEKKAKEIVNDVVEGFEKTGKNLEKKFK
jgi:predicted Holliday junction resolvase-like endonuclease